MVESKKSIKKIYKKRKTKKRLVPQGRFYIKATYNNTVVTATDQSGNVLAWATAGHLGFKGPKKATPYVASLIVRNLVEKINDYQMKQADVFIKGIGAGRDAAVRAINTNNININSIKDITSIPHNGCRPPKQRKV